MLSCSKSVGNSTSSLESIFKSINNDKIIHDSVSYLYNNDTIKITIVDTVSKFANVPAEYFIGYETTQANYILASVIGELDASDVVEINKYYKNSNNISHKLQLPYSRLYDQLKMFYINNSPFRDFTIYILDTLSLNTIFEFQEAINTLNNIYTDYNVNSTIIELVAEFSLECMDSASSNIARNRIFELQVLVNENPRMAEVPEFINYIVNYCNNKPPNFKFGKTFTLRQPLNSMNIK